MLAGFLGEAAAAKALMAAIERVTGGRKVLTETSAVRPAPGFHG